MSVCRIYMKFYRSGIFFSPARLHRSISENREGPVYSLIRKGLRPNRLIVYYSSALFFTPEWG